MCDRGEHDLGMSEAVNELIRRGLVAKPADRLFRQRTAPLGVSVDVSSVADALEVLDDAAIR
ncbi:MAG: CopG family transcriptional regulator [Acidimicrobiales bacterium]